MATRINFIEVYSAHCEFDASVIETLMEDCNIHCSIRTHGMLRFSVDPVDMPEKIILVEEDKADSARKIINKAIRNGVISKEGRFAAV